MVMKLRGKDRSAVVDAFSSGDELALAEVYTRWSPLVYSIALRSLGDVDEAEQVTSRVFTKAWSARQTFDPTQTPLSAWLIKITCATIDEARADRSDQRQPQTTTVAQMDDVIEPAALAEQLLLVDEISRLDAEPRQVLRMALFDELTHTQIAERTGLSSGTVRSSIHRSFLDLRTQLEVHPDAH